MRTPKRNPKDDKLRNMVLIIMLMGITVLLIVLVANRVIPPSWGSIADLSVLSTCIISMKGK